MVAEGQAGADVARDKIDVDAIEVSDRAAQHEQWQQAPADLAINRIHAGRAAQVQKGGALTHGEVASLVGMSRY